MVQRRKACVFALALAAIACLWLLDDQVPVNEPLTHRRAPPPLAGHEEGVEDGVIINTPSTNAAKDNLANEVINANENVPAGIASNVYQGYSAGEAHGEHSGARNHDIGP